MTKKAKYTVYHIALTLLALTPFLLTSIVVDSSASTPGVVTKIDCLYSASVQTIEGCGEQTGLSGAASVTVAPNGDYVYVAAYGSNALTAYRVDQTTGALTLIGNGCVAGGDSHVCGSDDGLEGATSVSVSPDGKFAYAAAYDSSTLTAYRVDQATGALTQIGNGCVAGGDSHVCGSDDGLEGATSIAVSSDGKFAYATAYDSSTLTAYRVDQATGVLTQISNGCVAGGNSHACGAEDGLEGTFDIELSTNGQFAYAASYLSNAVTAYRVNTSTGVLTQIVNSCIAGGDSHICGSDDGLEGATAIALSPDDSHAYTASYESNSITTYLVDADTGKLSKNGCIYTKYSQSIDSCSETGDLNGASSITITQDGKYLYASAAYSDTVSVYGVDSGSGALAKIDNGCIAGDDEHTCSTDDGLDGAESIALSPDGGYLYAASMRGNSLTAYTSGEPSEGPGPSPSPDPEPSPTPAPTPSPAPEPTPNPTPDTTASKITRFKASKSRLRRSSFKRNKKVSITFTYSLSEASTVTLELKSKVARKTCVKAKSGKRKCKRSRLIARRQANGKEGKSRVELKLNSSNLRPGNYSATLLAVDGSGNRSKNVRAGFRILR